MIVVDTSAWVEHQRATGSRVHREVARLLDERGQIAVTEIVVMEMLGGARDPAKTARFLRGFAMLRLQGLADFEQAARLYRLCREAGETVRKLTDCLVAVPTIRAGATLLHADQDFEKLARHSPLKVLPV